MKKIINIFKQLVRDKRGEAGMIFDTGFYKATSPKYEKLANKLNLEKKILDMRLLEGVTRFSNPFIGILEAAEFLCNPLISIFRGSRDCRYFNNYDRREKRYHKRLNKAIKKEQVVEIYKESG